jgi:hypothetical protein
MRYFWTALVPSLIQGPTGIFTSCLADPFSAGITGLNKWGGVGQGQWIIRTISCDRWSGSSRERERGRKKDGNGRAVQRGVLRGGGKYVGSSEGVLTLSDPLFTSA